MSKFRFFLLMVLTTFAWSAIMADDFNPDNPPEPDDIYVYKHNVKVSATPVGKGYASGTGKYAEGSEVVISTSSAEANWEFKHWLMNGVVDPEHSSAQFTFVLGSEDVEFTAVYEYVEPQEPELPPFDPADPAEPDTPVFPEPPVVTPVYTLTLVSSPFEACSFSANSGLSYEAGTVIMVSATGNQGFRFLGWYGADDILLAETTALTYTMPEEDSTLTARWVFDPTDDPADPESSQDNVSNPLLGDVNGDGKISVTDITQIVAYILGQSGDGFNTQKADMNGDGNISVTDITIIVNKILTMH